MDALRETENALRMSASHMHQELLYVELDAATTKTRDILSVRTQLHALPMGDKKKHHKVLENAYGGRIPDVELSKHYQSYRKTIWEKLEDAFPSNNKVENLEGRPSSTTGEGGATRSKTGPSA